MTCKLSIVGILLTSAITVFPSQQIQETRLVTPLIIKYNWSQEKYKEGDSFSISVPLYKIIPGYGEKADPSHAIQGLGIKQAVYDYFREHKLFNDDNVPFNSYEFQVNYAHRFLDNNNYSKCYANFAYVTGPSLKPNTNQ